MFEYSLPRDSLIKIYISFIRPVLEYKDIVWDNCTQREKALFKKKTIP